MGNLYILINNGSDAGKDIEEFLNNYKIKYVEVKTKYEFSVIIPPNNEPVYKEDKFEEFKNKFLNGLEEKFNVV